MNNKYTKSAVLQNLTYAIICSFLLNLTGCASAPDAGSTTSAAPKVSGKSEPKPGENIIFDVKVETAKNSAIIHFIANEPFKYTASMRDKHRLLFIEIPNISTSLAKEEISVNHELLEKVFVNNVWNKGLRVEAEMVLKQASGYELIMNGAVLSIRLTPKARKKAKKGAVLKLGGEELDSKEVHRLKEELASLKKREELIRVQLQKASTNQPTGKPKEGASPLKSVSAQPNQPKRGKSFLPEIDPQNKEETGVIVETIEQWRHAWQSKDFFSYAGFYLDTFTHKGQGRDAWLLSKKDKFAKAVSITVEIANIRISTDHNLATVVFDQRYRSGKYQDVGTKAITMIKTNDGWKIQSENWKPL